MSAEHLCHKSLPKRLGFYIVDDLMVVTVLPTHVVHVSVPLPDFLKFRNKEVIPWKPAGVYRLKITLTSFQIIVPVPLASWKIWIVAINSPTLFSIVKYTLFFFAYEP